TSGVVSELGDLAQIPKSRIDHRQVRGSRVSRPYRLVDPRSLLGTVTDRSEPRRSRQVQPNPDLFARRADHSERQAALSVITEDVGQRVLPGGKTRPGLSR